MSTSTKQSHVSEHAAGTAHDGSGSSPGASYSLPRPPDAAVHLSPPDGWDGSAPLVRRGPRTLKAEVALAGAAVADLHRFGDYGAIFEKIASPLPTIVEMLDAAVQWSAAHAAVTVWLAYAGAQASTLWDDAQTVIAKMRPIFELAAQADPTVIERFPSLARLLEVRSATARKGAAARTANNLLRLEGKEPAHGKAATKRKRTLRKAAALLAPPPAVTVVAMPAPDKPRAVSPRAVSPTAAPASFRTVRPAAGQTPGV